MWGAQAGHQALQPVHRDPWPLPWGQGAGGSRRVRCVDGWGKHKRHRWVDAAPAWSSWWLNLRGSSGTGAKYRPAN